MVSHFIEDWYEDKMGLDNPSKNHFSRFPDLGKLSLAIIKHVLEPFIGGETIKIAGVPYTNKQLYEKLCVMLVRVEKRLVSESSNSHLLNGLLQLSIGNLSSIQKSFWVFVENPGSPSFPLALYKQLSQDYPKSTDAERYSVVDSYVKLLKIELIAIDSEVRQKISAAALVDIQSGVAIMVDTLRSIDNGVKTIAENLSIRNPLSTRRDLKKTISNNSIRKVLVVFTSSFDKDTKLADIIVSHLSSQYDVRKQDLLLRDGSDWAERLNKEIEFSDLVIPIISEGVSLNELLIFELDKAYHLQNEIEKPVILPVRFRYLEPYPYPLSVYLSEIPYIVVRDLDAENIQHLTVELDRAFTGQPYGDVFRQSVQPIVDIPRPTPSIDPYDYASIDNPKGTMSKESRFYIERPQDSRLLGQVGLKQALINIKAPRQMGKSSMLIRGVEKARQLGKRIVFLDFQQLDTEHLHDSKTFYTSFCNWVAGNLNLDIDAEQFWKSPGSNNIKCTKFFKEILTKVNQPLLLAIDEIDRLLASPFRSDFFGLLRSWHIDRQNEAMSLLSIMLVISTEPILLIDDIASPFNVGENLDLDDFTPEQVADLNFRHNFPFGESQLIHLMTLIGGHPYLVRQAMYKVRTNEISADKLLSTATSEDGPFADHLLHHLFKLHRSKELRNAMQQILREHLSCSDEITYRLKSAGLVREKGRYVLPRYGIYADYFSEHLKGA